MKTSISHRHMPWQCVWENDGTRLHVIIFVTQYWYMILIIWMRDNYRSYFTLLKHFVIIIIWPSSISLDQRHSLTHRGRVTHICVGEQTIIGSDNGLSPGRHQAIIWTNARILFDWTLGNKLQWNNFSKLIHFHPRKRIWKYRLDNGTTWHTFHINVSQMFIIHCL